MIKDFDKMTFGKICEIESARIVWHSIFGEKCSRLGPNYAFNIFWMAFVGDGCRIRRRQKWHLWGADAAQKMLNCRICRLLEMVFFVKRLVANVLGKPQKTVFFQARGELVTNIAATEGQNVTFS